MSRPRARRWISYATAMVLAASLLVAVERPAPAAAAGPSADLPVMPPVPVTTDQMGTRPKDQAAEGALSGDQAKLPPKEGAGTSAATSLSPSANWAVSTQSGDFQWAYPLRVPPVPGDLVPDLALTYSSSAVDGRTSATNNQPSWAGDGWDLNPGFVERTYGACADDKEGGTVPSTTIGDLCWRSDNATASYGDGGGQLVCCDGDGRWRTQSDDGSRIERLGRPENGNESWKITTPDGTQYFFGSRAESKSTWTVPVYGDDANEPCNNRAGFAASRCTMPWRWNLDKVIDPNGNMMLLTYQTETNSYGVNGGTAAVPYIRGGWLDRIEYGLHETASSMPAAQVVFGVADRCVPGSTCTFDRPENWPDTPLNDRCEAATCTDKPAPTFWTTKRLATVTTQVRKDGSLTDVDRWTLGQQYPRPGDGEPGAALWLQSIVHAGLVGGTAELPPVTFEGTALPNRVYQEDNLSPLLRYRLTGIVSESGGVISVKYAEPDCKPGQSMPANAYTNTLRCFQATWARPMHAPRTDWFHKYVVETVTLSDMVSANMEEVLAYQYLDGAAWHYDTSEFTPADKRTWNEFRGYGKVRIRHGTRNDPAGPVSMSDERYYRGMDGDRLNLQGGTRDIEIEDSERVRRRDHDWLSAVPLETITYLGDSDTVVDKTMYEPSWGAGPTASRGTLKSYLVVPHVQRTFTTTESGRRETRVETGYDDRGQLTTVDDLGDTATADDDLCTRTTYARNNGKWLISYPSRTQTVSVACTATPTFPDDAVSDEYASYDGQDRGVAPERGNQTRTEVLSRFNDNVPVYALESTAGYDVHGRTIEAADALGRTTRTAYTPAEGGPTTQLVATDPKGFTTTSQLEVANGQALAVTDVNDRRSDTRLDPLGRVTEVWTPDRPRSGGTAGSQKFAYQIRRTGPTVVTTTKIGPNGTYISGNELYDGNMRLRQVQVPAVGGGRQVTDTRYDSQGRAYKTTRPYYTTGAVDANLLRASDADIPGQTETRFDGAGRPIESIFKAGATPRWTSYTRYGGDRVYVTPPTGGTPTATVTDARGNTVELRQYRGASATGNDFDLTRYEYDPSGQLTKVTDPAGNAWRYEYDLRGRQIRTDHPDSGESTLTYDEAGQLHSTTDARGMTLVYRHDELGRQLSTRIGTATGRLMAEWTYDTVPDGFGGVVKGQPAKATSYDAQGHGYATEVLAYTARYQQRKASVTIPGAEGPLAGTYTTWARYNPDGSLAGQTYQAIGGLFEEEVFHTYDDAGQPLTTYGGPEGQTVTYAADSQYTRYGELQRLQLGTGTKRVWQSWYFDPATRRLDRSIMDSELPRPMQSDVHYQYDDAGNVTSVADTPLYQTADRQCFRYDHLRRLTEAWTPAGADCTAAPDVKTLSGPAPYWQSYIYDAVGNRRTKVEHKATGDATTGYSYPAPGTERPHAVTATTGPQPQAFQYDAAGNATVRGTQQLTWDEAGRLAMASDGDEKTTFVYDASGARLLRRDPTATTLYLNGQELRLERGTGRLAATRYYTHGDRTVASRTESGLTWLANDHHGTTDLVIDAATMTVTKRRSDPFGNPRGEQPADWPNERGFVGGTEDESTGLTHLDAREYDPELGRFISVDPVTDPADPQQLNAYAYANNSPVTMSDPDGRRYFAGDYGWGSTPAAAEKVNASNNRVQKALRKQPKSKLSKPRHSKPKGKLTKPNKKAVSRAAQHDWNGADGPRGRVGGYNSRAVPRQQYGPYSPYEPYDMPSPYQPYDREGTDLDKAGDILKDTFMPHADEGGFGMLQDGLMFNWQIAGPAVIWVWENMDLIAAGFQLCAALIPNPICVVGAVLTTMIATGQGIYNCASNKAGPDCYVLVAVDGLFTSKRHGVTAFAVNRGLKITANLLGLGGTAAGKFADPKTHIGRTSPQLKKPR
ncbi:RHS repeat domain-containing protein [Micromonospora sp. NPDC093277]|uniref:RHS repeat domain-containing protein n=1 Tax=Micromonospora sp. NPDC093277 TaxID=3364291 RepID=UPI003813D51E